MMHHVRIRSEGLQQPQCRHARRREAAARICARESEDRQEVRGRRDGAEGPCCRRNHLECGMAFDMLSWGYDGVLY